MACKVDKCVCGCTLRTGTLILGILNLIAGICSLSYYGLYADDPHRAITTLGVCNSTQFWILTTVLLLGIPIGILYILGSRRDNPNHLRIGIYLHIAQLLVFCVIFFICGVQILMYTQATQAGVFKIFQVISGAVIGSYFILIVHSLRQELESGTASRNYA